MEQLLGRQSGQIARGCKQCKIFHWAEYLSAPIFPNFDVTKNSYPFCKYFVQIYHSLDLDSNYSMYVS